MATKFLDSEGLKLVWQQIKSKFVQQETGKGLSSNDYTTTEKTKLTNLEQGFTKIAVGGKVVSSNDTNKQVSIVAGQNITIQSDTATSTITINGPEPGESYTLADENNNGLMSKESFTDLKNLKADAVKVVKVNGTEVTKTNNEVDLTIPSKVSELTNDSAFQTESQVDTKIQTTIESKLSSVYIYKGTVDNYTDLPTSTTENPLKPGYVYNVVNANGNYPAGTNYAYLADGTWDALGGSFVLEALSDAEITAIFNEVFNGEAA